MPKVAEPDTIAPCDCGAPAILEERPHLKHVYAIHCVKRGRSNGRAGTAGCSLMPLLVGITRVSVMLAWNRMAGKLGNDSLCRVHVDDSGGRCPRCGLLNPHQCIEATPYRGGGEANLMLHKRVA